MWFRPRLKSVIAVVAAGTSLAYALGPSVAWASGGSTTAPAASAPLLRYDGETLFRGLFFRQGPVAQRLPNLSIAPRAPAGQEIATLDTLIAKMRQTDPQFFNRFATGIQSGNRVKVLAAIKDAQTVFDNVLTAAYHARAVVNPDTGDCLFLAAVLAVVLVVAGAGVLVVVVAGAAVLVYVYFWAPVTNSASRLAEEKWVNQIALSPLAA